MAGDEDQAEQVVTHGIVDGHVEILDGPLLPFLDLESQLLVFSLEPLGPAEMIDSAMFGGRHEPGARIVRDA